MFDSDWSAVEPQPRGVYVGSILIGRTVERFQLQLITNDFDWLGCFTWLQTILIGQDSNYTQGLGLVTILIDKKTNVQGLVNYHIELHLQNQ